MSRFSKRLEAAQAEQLGGKRPDADSAIEEISDRVDATSSAAIRWRAMVYRRGSNRVPPSARPPRLTAYQRDKIAEVPEAVAYLKRNGKRGASVSAVAVRIGVDRGTLATWIDHGWVSLDN